MLDLHLHSTASDGRQAPEAVVRMAAARGLSTIALTDHDTLDGVGSACRAAVVDRVRVISGCEFSVSATWGELHLLGYFLPLDDPVITAFLRDQRRERRERAVRMVERLRVAGVAVELDDVLAEAAGAAVGRPHVARALVRLGAIGDVQEAFRRYIGWGRPAFVPKVLPAIVQVTSLVRAAGGLTSAAHLNDRATRGALAMLVEQGVDAVEVLHPAHDEATASRIDRLADELGLLRTGGSDWHGDEGGADDRAPLGSIRVPEVWLDALERLHHERMAGRETKP
jgi:predicted metal-dependent phosphoesterase TrpH